MAAFVDLLTTNGFARHDGDGSPAFESGSDCDLLKTTFRYLSLAVEPDEASCKLAAVAMLEDGTK